MKNLVDPAIARFRDHEADRLFGTEDHERARGGAFLVPAPGSRGGVTQRAYLRVIASAGRDQPAGKDPASNYRWDHVSVSLSNRCPTWEEMDFIKRLFFKPEEVCFQLHVAEAANISNHAFCLHIWRPLDVAIPLPPSDMVGLPGLKGGG